MGLSYHYTFSAPSGTSASTLESFLRSLEHKARTMGFAPTTVLNVPFDTQERRQFSKRLGGYCHVEDSRLIGEFQLQTDQVWHHDHIKGSATLIPTHGVLLVVTDEHRHESCFGFFKYPAVLSRQSGELIMPTPSGNGWYFCDVIKTPEPRYRTLVDQFKTAGYLADCRDDFDPSQRG
jgi:hypothetical protein